MKKNQNTRRHSKIELVQKKNRKYVKKEYVINEQFERELEGYERLHKLLEHVTNAECGNILNTDSENGTIEIEYIEGVTLSKAIEITSHREWGEIGDTLCKVLSLATQNKIHFDCDPSNILVVEEPERFKLIFIDPECIKVDLEPFAASVFFVGLYKLVIKSLIRPKTAYNILRKTFGIKSKLKTSLVSEISLMKGMSKYSWYCATSNVKVSGYDTFTMRLFRIFVLTPFWIFSAILFRFLSIGE